MWDSMDIHVVSYLAGGIPTPLKNMSKSVGVIIPNLWKNKKRSKPPTRYDFMIQSGRMVILVEVIGFWIGLIWDFPNKKS